MEWNEPVIFGVSAKDVLLLFTSLVFAVVVPPAIRTIRRNLLMTACAVVYFGGFALLMQQKGDDPITGTQAVLAIFGTIFMVSGFIGLTVCAYFKGREHGKAKK